MSNISVKTCDIKGEVVPANPEMLEDIKRHGLGNYIVVDRDLNLLNGRYRLAALRALGIENIIVDMVNDAEEFNKFTKIRGK